MIITAGDIKFKRFVDKNKEQAERLGLDMKVYDLGGLGYGEKVDVREGDLDGKAFPPCIFKIEIIRRSFPGNVMFLDGDAILQKPLDIQWDFDIGVTVRRNWRDGAVGKINAGVMFFADNDRTREFLDLWEETAIELNGDQHAINELLKDHILNRDGLVEKDGLKVRSFPTDIYNNYYFAEDQSKARVIHYKGGYKGRI